MGEIADMMLDGTMDCETGEWNFGGQDGPGFPMTGAEAAAYARGTGSGYGWDLPGSLQEPVFKVAKRLRKKIEAFGALKNNDRYHWQVRKDGKVVADWWPHKRQWRIAGKMVRGDESAFVAALTGTAQPQDEAPQRPIAPAAEDASGRTS